MGARRFPIVGLALLAACAGADPPLGPVVHPLAPGSTEPLRFNALNMGQMRRGTEIGRYVWDIDCGSPYGRVFWTSGMGFRRENTFRERFAEAFGDAGFDVVGAVYADGADRQRARYVVTGELREVRLELCRRRDWLFGGDGGISGTGSVKIDWTMYASEEQRVVHRTSTTGHAAFDDGVPEGDVLLIEDGFSTAVAALAAEPGLRAAGARGGPPVPPAMGGAAAGPPPVPEGMPVQMPGLMAERVFGPVHLAPPHVASPVPDEPAPFLGPLEDNAGRIAAAMVRVGAGRGVVVGAADGHALVLAPRVAGDTVPVQAGPVRELGTIVRRDAASGLMLVRVPVPLPARLAALPRRPDPPEVSEPVYTTADGVAFAPGLVAGLVAGLAGGIQADLEEEPEPGDPLLDEAGNLLGVALAGRREAGLSRFVPIADALAALTAPGTVPARDAMRQDANLDGPGLPPT